MAGEDDDFERLTTSFASLIKERSKALRAKVDTLSAALQDFSDRVSKAIDAAKSTLNGAAAAGPAGQGAGAALGASTGIVLVRVVNDPGQPVPVLMAGAAQAKPQGGLLGSIAGAIGGFVGGVVGGVVGGLAMPVALVALGGEIVAGLVLAGPLVKAARALVNETTSLVIVGGTFALLIIAAIDQLIDNLFARLTQAGILPVSNFLASVLVFLDVALRLFLTYLKPVLDYVSELIEGVANYLNGFLLAIGTFIKGIADAVGPYLVKLMNYLFGFINRLKEAIHDMLVQIATTIIGLSFGFNAAVVAAAKFFGDYIANKLALVINDFAVMIDSLFTLLGKKAPGYRVAVPAAPGDFSTEIGKGFAEGKKLGSDLGKSLVDKLFESKPDPNAPTLDFKPFQPPGIKLPRLPVTPSMLKPLIEGVGEEPPRGTDGFPTRPGLGSDRAKESERPTGLTINGGIQIQINAGSIDLNSADAVARRLVEQLSRELQRLAERERFRLGLSGQPAP